MAIALFKKTAITGGGNASLDGIDHLAGGPGSRALITGDICKVMLHDDWISYEYEYDSSVTDPEVLPYIIKPDSNSGAGRWLIRISYNENLPRSGGALTGNLIFSDDGEGIIFSDGSKILRSTGSGLKIVPHSDSYLPTVRNALDNADVLVLKPPSNANALTGTSVNEPITPANLDYVLDSRVGTANAADVKIALNASGDTPIYACRAWVNFNGTGTISIRASGNISSLTDNGTGDYTIQFATPMPDVNYTVVTGAESESAYPAEGRSASVRYNTRQTGSVRLNAGKPGPSPLDVFGVFVAIFR